MLLNWSILVVSLHLLLWLIVGQLHSLPSKAVKLAVSNWAQPMAASVCNNHKPGSAATFRDHIPASLGLGCERLVS